MRGLFLSGAAALVLFGSVGAAIAQDKHHGGPGGGAARSSGGGAVHAPGGGGMRSAPSGGFRGQVHSPRASQAPRAYQAPRASQAPRAYQERSRRVERSPQHSERSRQAEPRRVDRDRQQRAQRELRQNKQQNKQAERNRERLSTGQKAVEGRQGRDASGRGVERVAERHNEIQQARTKLGAQDRERLHKAFNFDRARVTRVNFDHHVGRRIPRHVRLFPIPAAVFAFFPYYRDYSYFVVDDEICIVDRESYVVVDVIDQGYWSGGGRPQVAELRLSEGEIALVRDSIPRDFPDSGLRLRLALGAEIPDDVQLHEFPVLLLDRVPQLREYRFLVSGDQIVIVSHNRSIALVVDRA
jgi:hypothetical protein